MASSKWIGGAAVDKILNLNAAGYPAKQIAIEAGVSRATVYREVADYARRCRIAEKQSRDAFETIQAIERLTVQLREEVVALATSRRET